MQDLNNEQTYLIPSGEVVGKPAIVQGSPMSPRPQPEAFENRLDFLAALTGWEVVCEEVRAADRAREDAQPRLPSQEFDKQIRLTIALSEESTATVTMHLLPETYGLHEAIIQLDRYVASLLESVREALARGATQIALGDTVTFGRTGTGLMDVSPIGDLTEILTASGGSADLSALPQPVQDELLRLLSEAAQQNGTNLPNQ